MPQQKTRTARCVVQYTDEPEVILTFDSSGELESVDELGDFQFVYALAHRALEHESLACETDTARAQIAHLLDRLTSIEWLVAE